MVPADLETLMDRQFCVKTNINAEKRSNMLFSENQ